LPDRGRPQIASGRPGGSAPPRAGGAAGAGGGASIFLEKPFARTPAEADEMVTACERHHVKLAIAHQTRYSPRLQRVRELISEGRLGDVLEMHGRGKEDPRGGGQDLMVLGTHLMDLMRLLAGDAQWCFARVSQAGRPVTRTEIREGGEGMGPIAGDQIGAVYGFAGGVQGTFGTYKAKESVSARFGLHIYGSKGVIQLRTGGLPAAYFL